MAACQSSCVLILSPTLLLGQADAIRLGDYPAGLPLVCKTLLSSLAATLGVLNRGDHSVCLRHWHIDTNLLLLGHTRGNRDVMAGLHLLGVALVHVDSLADILVNDVAVLDWWRWPCAIIWPDRPETSVVVGGWWWAVYGGGVLCADLLLNSVALLGGFLPTVLDVLRVAARLEVRGAQGLRHVRTRRLRHRAEHVLDLVPQSWTN